MSNILRNMSDEMIDAVGNRNVVIISGFHDYRTGRRGSMQAIADGLVQLGYNVTFISIRFSLFSLVKGDSRNFLWSRANRPEIVNSVQCYLWRTLLHPFYSRSALVSSVTARLSVIYGSLPNEFIDGALRSASYIIIESGLAVMLLRRARRLNASAKIIYRASDKLETIGAHPIVQRELEASHGIIDHYCLLAAKMAPDFAWAGDHAFAVPLGVYPPEFSEIGSSPYPPGTHAVSVGSMLFDAEFFVHTAPMFPNIQFHVIGPGARFDAPQNVRIYQEMGFRQTLPYIKHATFGIAPYRESPGSEYLSQSSLKLMQYEYLGIPAVCPQFAVGKNSNRFGYVPGDVGSMKAAIDAAIDRVGRVARPPVLRWDEVARRILNPQAFPDTNLLNHKVGAALPERLP